MRELLKYFSEAFDTCRAERGYAAYPHGAQDFLTTIPSPKICHSRMKACSLWLGVAPKFGRTELKSEQAIYPTKSSLEILPLRTSKLPLR
nr:hypothetical protein CFP56_11733 [Quercus suber]